MKELTDILKTVVGQLESPALIVMFLVIVALFLMLYHKDKCITSMSKDHNAEMALWSVKVVNELNEVQKTMEKQVELFRLLIYKKRGG